MAEKSKGLMFGSLLIGAAFLAGLLAIKRRREKRKQENPKFPITARWRPIGTLKNLLIFPMKSGGYFELDEVDCTEIGPAQVSEPGRWTLKDRSFVVYRPDTKEMILCMTYPKMISIKILPLSEKSVIFKCNDKPDLEVKIPTLNEDYSNNIKTKMWTEEIMNCLDCGNEAADWITEIIKGDKNVDNKLRLGYWSHPDKWQDGSEEDYDARGAYQNYTSYMMMCTSSLNDLQKRIPDIPIDFKQFRPNFMIETPLDPFSEDNWTWVKIGEEAVFIKIKNCSRCSQININPETSKFHPKQEPLNTLSKYRYRKDANGPVMGICLGLYTSGKVRIGDPVYISV